MFFSEGIDYNIWDMMGSAGTSGIAPDSVRRGDGTILLSRAQDAIAAATRANVNIYAIDPRGLSTGAEDSIEMSGLPIDAESVGLGASALQDELRDQQQSLRTLAEETGGFASVSSNDFSNAFRRIVDENSSYYVLGYYPTNDRRDGRFRRIEVRLKRPGLAVVARKGYAAPTGKAAAEKKAEASAGTSKELRDALNSPLQMSGLKLALFAAPMKGPSRKAAIALVTEFLGREFAFTEKDGKYLNTLEMSYMALDKQGKVADGKRDAVALSFKPETYRRVLESGMRVQSRLELPPGSYQLRVAVRESGGRTGSVFYDLVRARFREGSAQHQRSRGDIDGGGNGAHRWRHSRDRRRAEDAAHDVARLLHRRRALGARRGVRQPGGAVALGGHHGHAQGGRPGTGLLELRDAVEQGARRRQRGVRLHEPHPAEGPRARPLRPHHRGQVHAGRDRQGLPRRADSDCALRRARGKRRPRQGTGARHSMETGRTRTPSSTSYRIFPFAWLKV